MRFLRRFQENGSILFVSHDTSAVLGFCDRALWLDQGRTRAIGPAKPVVEDYLAAFAEGPDGDAEAQRGRQRNGHAESGTPASQIDARIPWLNASPHRNDIELFAFKPDGAAFGRGKAEIVGVRLETEDGQPFSWCVGGEIVTLAIDVLGHDAIRQPIVGFLVKDRLGQNLFGDNTYLRHEGDAVPIAAGERLRARFRFRMPILAVGTYTIAVAVADGSVADHVQHHWIHDALAFTSHTSSAATGLVGVPMHEISLERTGS